MALMGSAYPRVAPPLPNVSRIADYRQAAEDLGLSLLAWQVIDATYVTALTAAGKWLYPEVCSVCARQQGKTTKLLPRILMELRDGGKTLHTAQDRALPRLTFEELADRIDANPELRKLVPKGGIRSANGTESIKFSGGGRYTLVAPGHGIRGHSADLVIEDEVREQRDDRVKRAMGPTLTASKNPQRLYLSNAGDEDSVILNELRDRPSKPNSFAYLEWSAAPDRAIDDRNGWAEANPALGSLMSIEFLENQYQSYRNAPAGFETEHLCRWVLSMQPGLVDAAIWEQRRVPVSEPVRPQMAVALDPSGKRASVAVAWLEADKVRLQITDDVEVETIIDTDRFGQDLQKAAAKVRSPRVGLDLETEGELAKYLRRPESITGAKFTAACAQFVQLAESGRLEWSAGDREAASLSLDIKWTVRKVDHEDGTFRAVKAKEARPITAVLAAIRAVWLASGPQLSGVGVF